MLAVFCVRLAAGMAACLLLLSPAASARPAPGTQPVANANFFRTHLLTVLGFAVLALLVGPGPSPWVVGLLVLAAACAAAGSVSWSLVASPGGVTLIVVTAAALAAALVLLDPAHVLAGLSSAFLLGAVMSAMLMGHNYLVAPGLSLTPLFRLLTALAAALAVRAAIDGYALLRWTADHPADTLMVGDRALWLPVRWLVGLAGTAVLCGMAWQTARIRSTQSATGILYVAVIFAFLGELTGQLLRL
ncbi:MAG: hypothetical protein ACRC33_23505 [Gemmataceae bacterium]